jgi:hypothetical protein
MEEQFIQDGVEAELSTRGDTQIPHSPVKVVGKGKRLANKGCSPKRSNSAKEKISPKETVESDKTIQTIKKVGTSAQDHRVECPQASDSNKKLAPKGRSPSPPRRGKRTRSQTSNLYEQDNKAERSGKGKTKKIKPNKSTKASKRGRKKRKKVCIRC